MKRKLAVILSLTLLLSGPGMNINASELNSQNADNSEIVNETEELEEQDASVGTEDSEGEDNSEEKDTEENKSETDINTEEGMFYNLENALQPQSLEPTEEDTIENNADQSDEEQKELENSLMNGIETLPDDPEYVNILEDRLEAYNSPTLASFGYNGYSHNDRFSTTTIRNGIDVSYYQGDIDWNAVRASGIEFAFIRVGYRGYEAGTLGTDSKAAQNLRGAIDAGLKVGAYIFSQALSEGEAVEEADFVLNQVAGYGISLPLVIDYEYVATGKGRLYNAHLSQERTTATVNAFCATIQRAGYTPMVYANKNMLESSLNAGDIPYKVWLANYTNETSYAGNYEFWQYSSKGGVSGINGNVDHNFWYDSSVRTYKQTIADGVYSIESALASGMFLDINGASYKNCANLQLWNGDQKFKVTYLGNGKYSIVALCSGKYLDAENGGRTNGTNVLQYSRNGGENQKWYIEDVGGGNYCIVSAASNLYLDVANKGTSNGTNLLLWQENGGINQKFKFVKPSFKQTIADGEYTIESSTAGMLLDINGASANNCANLQLWKGTQKFRVTYMGDGKYSLEAMCSGKYLDAEKAGTTNGTNVLQYSQNGGENQQWYIQDVGYGYFNIQSANSLLCLDAANGGTTNGTNILLWEKNGGANQKFRFNKANYTQTLDSGEYQIESALGDGMLLDVAWASKDNCANVEIWKGSQTFKVSYNKDGKYAIMATCSGKYLDAEKNGKTDGTNVIQYAGSGTLNQYWYLEDAGNGYYYIRSASSLLCLDISNGNATNGANVLLWSQNGGLNQKFKFNKVN